MNLQLCLQIAYHEKLVMPIEYSGSLENTIGRHHHFVTMTVVLTPNSNQKRFRAAVFKGEEINDCFNNPGAWQVKAVNSGIKTALSYGSLHRNNYTPPLNKVTIQLLVCRSVRCLVSSLLGKLLSQLLTECNETSHA